MAICPQEAVSVGDHALAAPVGEVPPSDKVLNLIKARRSVRAFEEQKVKREDWEKLVEAIKYSPTGHNAQYIDVMIVESPEALNEISKIGMDMMKQFSRLINKPVLRSLYKRMLGDHTYSVFSKNALFYEQQKALVERGLDPILFHAPALMLFIAPKSEAMSKNDADLAAQTVALYAPTLGLGTCYSGIAMVAFSGQNSSAKKVVRIPQGYKVCSALMVGYPKHQYRYIPYRKDRKVYYA
jgi:nitroreductase